MVFCIIIVTVVIISSIIQKITLSIPCPFPWLLHNFSGSINGPGCNIQTTNHLQECSWYHRSFCIKYTTKAMKIKCMCAITIIIQSCFANKPLSTRTPPEMLQAAFDFVAWISIIRIFKSWFFERERLSPTYEHDISNAWEERVVFHGTFRFCVSVCQRTGRNS